MYGGMMQLADYLEKEHIVADLQGNTKYEAIEELLKTLKDSDKLVDLDVTLQDVMAREGYLSTGLENGLAIPHAKTDGVSGLVVALGRKKEGIDFESLDGKPANLIFLVLSPRDTSGPHIQTLAVISRNMKEADLRQALLDAETAEEMAEIIKEKFK